MTTIQSTLTTTRGTLGFSTIRTTKLRMIRVFGTRLLADRFGAVGHGINRSSVIGLQVTALQFPIWAPALNCDKKRDRMMKANVIVVFLLSIVTASQLAFATVRRKLSDDAPPHVAMVGVAANNAHVLADIVEIPPVIFRGPRDVLRDYELEMASIAERLSMDLRVISNAVGTGEITREQREYASGERYQVAMMQFQLFSALHTILEQDIARPPFVPEPAPSHSAEMVVVAMPFSSLQLNPSLVEYLGLNRTQVTSIQRLMDQERSKTEPLLLELRTISAELGVTIQHSQSNDSEAAAQKLAATQARLLKHLMIANSRLQRRIDDVLNPQQRKKLDAFKRTCEIRVGEGN
jgi:Spy/CpxP family protein refolding chaperone